MPTIQGPDGRTFSFPDDASRQEILTTMQRYYAAEDARKDASLDQTQDVIDQASFLGNLANPVAAVASVGQRLLRNRARSGETEQDAAKDEGFLDRSGSLLERGYQSMAGGGNRFVGTLTGSEVAKRNARVSEQVAGTEIEGTTSWEEAKQRGGIRDYLKFGAETAIQSLPEMALTATPFVGLGAEAVVQTGRIAQERAQADNRYEATRGDLAIAAPFGVASAALEKVGVDAVIGKVASKYGGKIVNSTVGRIATGAAGEAITEGIQSPIEYAGGSIGTKAGFDPAVALDQSIAGAVGGGVAGGTLSTGVEVGRQVYRLSNKAVPRGEIQSSTELTPEDQASPLANELLVGGMEVLRGPEAEARANAILAEAGLPEAGSRVRVTDWNGDTKEGTIEDAFTTEDSGGVKIRWDDGSVFEDHFADIRDADVRIEAVPQTAEEITAQMAEDARQQQERTDAALSNLPVDQEPESAPEPVADVAPVQQQQTLDLDQNIQAFKNATRRAESGGDDRAKNPRSSAAGRYQFTDGTWIATYKAEFGSGESNAAILAKKFDGDLQERLMDRLTRDNARGLSGAGIAVNPTSLYVAHFAGIYGAKKLYQAAPGASVESVLGKDVVDANPFLRGMSASEAIADLGRRVGQKGDPTSAPGLTETVATPEDTSDPWAEAFERFRENTREEQTAAEIPETELLATDPPIVAPEAAAQEISSLPAQADYGGAPQDAGGAPAESLPASSNIRTNKLTVIVDGIDAPTAERISASLPEGVSLTARQDGGYSAPVRYESAIRAAVGVPVPSSPEIAQAAPVASGRSAPTSQASAPVDMLRFVSRNGGLSYDGLAEASRKEGARGHDLKNTGSLKGFIPGAGPLLRPNGKSLDEMGELLWDAGYFGPPATTPRPTENDVLQAIDESARTKEKRYSFFDQAPETAMDEPDAEAMAAQEEAGRYNSVRTAWDDAAAMIGLPPPMQQEINAIRAKGQEYGVAPISEDETDAETIKQYIVDTANAQLDDARLDAFYEVEDELYADIEEQFRRAVEGSADRNDAPEGADRGTSEPGPAPDARDAGEEPRGSEGRPTRPEGDGSRVTPDPETGSLGLLGDTTTNPAVAERQRTETQLRAEAPLRGSNRTGQEQDGTMGLGLFDAGDQPQMDLPAAREPKSKLRSLIDAKKPKQDSAEPRQGEAGMMLSAGEVVRTSSGRVTTPFPKTAADTERKVGNVLRNVDKWLVSNALAEAEARGDDFNAPMFRQMVDKPKNISQSDKDSAEQYLFGEQPPVIPSIFKPLTAPQETATPAPETPAQSNVSQEPIEDFGEKLEGARKDLWQAYGDRLRDAKQEDVQAVPLSKSWPEPDYQKLIEGGADPYTVASMRAIRDAVPTKPRSYGVVAWGKQVEAMRSLAEGLLAGENVEAFQRKLEGDFARSLRDLQGSIDLYTEFGHERSFKGISFANRHYSLYRGERDVTKWTIEQKAKATAFSNWPRELAVGDTKNEVIAKFAMLLADGGLDKKKSDLVRFDIYSKRGQPGFWIGKKIGKDYADLKQFETAKEARAFKVSDEGYVELVSALEQYKDIPAERKTTNSPRIGINHRNGADVTPEQFNDAFGFRGVQFGNYVEGPRRQADLNQAYDALFDLAGVLNVPAKALSLNGTLGLAFGARGKGGKGAAAAHYERGNIVINLTKNAGAGSLAHEWWHSLDNYFSRQRGQSDEYVSEGGTAEGIRPEMKAAFENVVRTINSTGLKERSRNLDKRRTKDYWSTGREMSARVFENYVIAKLADEQHSNDYLANVVSEEAFNLEDGYPYLTAGEIPDVRAAFDGFFQTVETKETDTGVALYRRPDAEPAQSVDLPALQARLEQVGLSRKASVALVDSLNGAAGSYENALIRIATDTAQDQAFTLNHEIIHALRDFGMIGNADWAIMSARARREDGLMRSIRQRYEGPLRKAGLKGDALTEAMTEEAVADMFARYQRGDFAAKGLVARVFDKMRAMLEAVRNAFAGRGLRTAEGVFGDIDAGRMQGRDSPMGRDRRDMVVYHGTPHDFDTFSLDAIGTGEGAQAYGYGLYFAGKKEIAEYYKRALSRAEPVVKINGRVRQGDSFSFAASKIAEKQDDVTVADLRAYFERGISEDTDNPFASGMNAEMRKALATLDAAKSVEIKIEGIKGRLFEVDIPEDGEYLLYDEPLSQQPDAVKPAIEAVRAQLEQTGLLDDYLDNLNADWSDVTGGELVRKLFRRMQMDDGFPADLPEDATRALEWDGNADKAGALWLRSLGIAGIKYLDGGSRNAQQWTILSPDENTTGKWRVAQFGGANARTFDGEAEARAFMDKQNAGSYNYVLFDDAAAKVLAKYSIPEALPDAGHNFDDATATVSPQARAMVASLTGGTPDTIKQKVDDWRVWVQDKMLPVLRLQEVASRALGRDLRDTENPYLQEELMTGRAGARLERLSEDVIDPLFQAMHDQGVTTEQLETYLYARHAQERNAQIAKINPGFAPGEGSGMTDTQARAILNRIKRDGKQETMEALASYVDRMLKTATDTRVEAGLLSREEADAWAETYKHYVPLRGKKEVDGDVSGAADRVNSQSGATVRGKESKRAFGRRSEADNILAYSILQAEEAIIRAEKNWVARAFLKLARSLPDTGIWKLDKVETKRRINPTTGLVENYVSNFLSPAEDAMTVTAKEDGKEYRVTLNRDNPMAARVAEAMRNLEDPKFNKVMEMASWLNRGFSAINTRYNPAFVITNALRDIQTMAVIGQQFDIDGFATKVMRDYPRALTARKEGSGGWSKWRREWELAGGKIYFNQTGDLDQIKQNLRLHTKRLSSPNVAAKAWVKTFDALEMMNDSVERSIRLSVYKNAREAGRTKAQAASMARNITVNFTRKGRLGPAMNSFYAFFNAAVQGNTNLILAAVKSRNVRKAMGGFIIAGFLTDMLNSMLSGDDDDGEKFWDKVPDFEKSRNLILMLPGSDEGSAIKLPLGFGLNALFGLGRNVSAMMRGAMTPGEAASQSALEFVEAFNPLGSGGSWINVIAPTMVDPFVETSVNKDFTGKPIQPEQSPYEPDVNPSQNFYPNVAGWAKGLAEALNTATGGDEVVAGSVSVSPEVIEYMGGFVTGGAGRFVSDIFGLVTAPFDPEAETTIRDVPFAKTLYTEKSPWVDKSTFYERKREVEAVRARAKEYAERQDREGFNAYLAENRSVAQMDGLTKEASKLMSGIRKERNAASFQYELGRIDKARYADVVDRAREAEDRVVQAYNKRWVETVETRASE